MATDTLPMPVQPMTPAVAPPSRLEAGALENLMLNGDLSKLSPAQQATYYKFRCEALGLDPASTPFAYMVLQGKKILYALKSCTDQLTAKRKISLTILERAIDPTGSVCEVTCRATMPDGRVCDDVGVVSVSSLKGEALSNAIMKAVTKAKRRTVLSACGLGMLDESEIKSIDGARREFVNGDLVIDGEVVEPPKAIAKHASNDSGHGRTGTYASPEQVKAFNAWIKEMYAYEKPRWEDAWIVANKDFPPGLAEFPLPSFQLISHLHKAAVRLGKLQPITQTSHPETGEPIDKASVEEKRKMVAILHARDFEWLDREGSSYYWQEAVRVAQKYARENPAVLLPSAYDFEDEPADAAEQSQELIPAAAMPTSDDDPEDAPWDAGRE